MASTVNLLCAERQQFAAYSDRYGLSEIPIEIRSQALGGAKGRVYRSLSEYAAGLTADDFKEVDWPHEDGSSRQVYAHLVRTFVRHLGACQVLVVKERLDQERLDQPLKEVRYWATSELQADLASVVGWAAQRWVIEQFIADVKEVFGSDHDQLRSAKAIVRFWHLVFLGYLYLDEQRANLRVNSTEPELTIGQTPWHQQRRQRCLFLDWMHARYAEGLTSEQVDQLLAA